MKSWLTQHRTALRGALGRLAGSPLNTVLALLVIGIALALPAAGWLAVENAQRAAGRLAGVHQISLFLDMDAGETDVAAIKARLRTVDAGEWRFIPRAEALRRLQESRELAEVIASLPRNPLPDAFVVEPRDTAPAAMQTLAGNIASWPKVAHVQLDSAWAERFAALLDIGRTAVVLLGTLFAAALVAVTFNTIRLQILAQSAEIELARLIGATDAWVRRPFLYFGLLQGAGGGLLAGALSALGTRLLAGPVSTLAALYDSHFVPAGPSPTDIALLAALGGLLGLAGAYVSVAIHLRQPRIR